MWNRLRQGLLVGLMAVAGPMSAPADEFPPYDEISQANAMLHVKGFRFTGGMLKQRSGKPTCNGLETAEAAWTGSGFLVDRDGTLMTNFHVANKARRAVALFEDGARYEVKFIKAYDRKYDFATMKLDGKPRLKPVGIGDSDNVKPRDKVLAVGSPKGIGLNVTEGKVSQVRRDDYGNVVAFMHTAPIAGGNSGGPLYKGQQVVGVNTATLSGTQFHLARPINIAKTLLTEKFDKPVLLTAAFPTDIDRVEKRIEPLGSIVGTVGPGKTKYKDVRFDALTDYIIATKTANADLDIYLAVPGRRNAFLGCAESTHSKREFLAKSFQSARKVRILIKNQSNRTVKFGLAIGRIDW